MEEQFKNIDDIAKKLVQEAGLHQPSAHFMESVMKSVTPKTAIQPYKPLLSKRAWVFIVLGFVSMMFALYIVPATDFSLLKEFSVAEYVSFKNPFSEVKMNKTTVYGIVFLSLFMLQIPFLKHFLEKNR
ncbi:hypothetical protein [Ulvibacter litoralis]|uniref:Uncharacterized protein n=1 Tax=Ulvibacter litoralis TaxID=227084 RepID=A0A1G7GTQ9_9FLAO|nr:hypothetical protein [Ulvibacter litoralis]GHC55114.1 hypothetical protein GCM10008083_19010 [Ulvibacter litoralis]SDE91484.1 hypothetical protein SAMN05421855_103323 [Ulvibacter litoralis]